MRPLAFPQALAVVGLLGLTLALTLGADAIFAIAFFRSVFRPLDPLSPPPATGAAIALLATAVAIPLAVLAAAWRMRKRDDAIAVRPLTRSELLAIVGLLGLIVVAARSPVTALVGAATDWGSTWAFMAAMQVIAFLIPLAVLLRARGAIVRERWYPDGDHAITAGRLLTALALLALMVAAATAPARADDIALVWTGARNVGMLLALAVPFAAPLAAIAWARRMERFTPAESMRLLAVVALILLAAAVAVVTSPVTLLLAFAIPPALLLPGWLGQWRNADAAPHRPAGGLPAGVALLGGVFAVAAIISWMPYIVALIAGDATDVSRPFPATRLAWVVNERYWIYAALPSSTYLWPVATLGLAAVLPFLPLAAVRRRRQP